MTAPPGHFGPIMLDVEKCIAVGQCLLAAPNVFDLDDAGIVVLLESFPPESERPAVLNAITRCPADVIYLADDGQPAAAVDASQPTT
jgi:ferredoxin